MTTPKERALPLLEEALSILLSDDPKNRDKTTENNVRRAKNRLVRTIFWNRDEPFESAHIQEVSFAFFASSMNSQGKVDGQGVKLEEIF